ncbi:ABC transporter ATP-binding protein [Streptomyces parvus]|uniref:ABC transporter ATP-binding protein n=1 Tax=Streptomyces parvus TaxID=66428 RepID=UPI0035DA8BE0
MTAILEARGLGKRYGRRQALTDCTLSVPSGRVVGLVGPNGAGKSTLLQLACGLLTPTSGTIEVLGERPASGPAQLARVGFVAQDTPTYAALSVADHLRLGARLNPTWDAHLAEGRIRDLGLDPGLRVGRLSGGQRAQVALTLAVSKRPDLLILDEPVAALDPLARREFLQGLMEYVAEHGTTVILSSHLVSDLERVCDHLVSLVASRVQIAGDVDDLLGSHFRLTTARRDAADLPEGMRVLQATHTERQSTFIVRTDTPGNEPDGVLEPLGLEDLVLTYMAEGAAGPARRPVQEAQR